MTSKPPELSGTERDAAISSFAEQFPEPQNDKVRLRVSDPDSGRASTFRLKGADASHLGTLMRTFGMKTEASPDRDQEPRTRGRRSR